MNVENEANARADRGSIRESRASVPQDVLQYFRGLIGQIEIALPGHGSRVLMVSGSMAGEGTTEVIVGLAFTLATEMGRKTAIIDGNFRHPDLRDRFGTGDSGLTEYLAGEIPLEVALANTVIPNLYVMPTGSRHTSLAPFAKDHIRNFLSELRSRFEYVLIDAAPIGTYPECVALCDKVDAVVLVVRHGSTRREVVRRTRELIERAGGRILGVVLNKRRFPVPDFLYRKL